MPRVKRRAKRRRDYTKQEINLLTTGISLTTRFGALHKGLADMAAMREAWDDLRDELLPQWIESHPFSRPIGWLLFDATQPRIAVVGEAALESLEWTRSHSDYRQHDFFALNHRLGIEDNSRDSEAAFESEKQYLTRIGALTESELALL
jgi:hypothetical protein